MVGARSRSRPIQIHSHQPESDLNDPVALTQWSGGDQKSFALTATALEYGKPDVAAFLEECKGGGGVGAAEGPGGAY